MIQLPKLVYISGAISLGDVDANVQKAINAAIFFLNNGAAPICPHLSVRRYPHAELGSAAYERILAVDFALVSVSDAVFRLRGKSGGAQRECQLARELGIPIYTNRHEALSYLLRREQRKAA